MTDNTIKNNVRKNTIKNIVRKATNDGLEILLELYKSDCENKRLIKDVFLIITVTTFLDIFLDLTEILDPTEKEEKTNENTD